MPSLVPLFVQVLLILRTVAASSLEAGPQPTSVEHDRDSIDTGMSPRPTPGPGLRAVSDAMLMPLPHGGLVKRDFEDWLCGYESAISTSRITCRSDRTCFFTTTPGTWGNFGCCANSNACTYQTTCVERTQICNDACLSNPRILKCTVSSLPYCASYSNPEHSVTAFICDPSITRTWVDMRFTYSGQLPRSGSLLSTRRSSSSNGLAPLMSSSSSAGFEDAVSSRTTPAPTTTRRPTSLVTTRPATGTAPASNEGEDPEVTPTPKPKRTPIGAIVGGLIGGLAIIAAVVVAIIFLCIKRRRTQQQQLQNIPPTGAAMLPQQQQHYEVKPPVGVTQQVYPVVSTPGPQPQQQAPQQQQQQQAINQMPQQQQQQPSYFAPVPGKLDAEQQQQQQLQQQQQNPTESMFFPNGANVTGGSGFTGDAAHLSHPGSPLPAYHQGGYVPSASPPPPPVPPGLAPLPTAVSNPTGGSDWSSEMAPVPASEQQQQQRHFVFEAPGPARH